MQPIEPVFIISIHDRHPEGYLSVDLCNILSCLQSYTRNYLWVGFDLEFATNGIADGIHFETPELLSRSLLCSQMIDGVFIAYEKDCPDATSARPDYTAFPHSKARAAIAAVDSSWFEVYTKEAAIIAQLKASFVEVREEDPQLFFMA